MGLERLSGPELLKLGALYRRLTGDLAYARQRYADESLVVYLNRLAQRGYSQVYAAHKEKRQGFFNFFFQTFPGVLRRRMALFAFVTILMYAPAVYSFVAVRRDETAAEVFMSGGFREMVHDRISRGVAADTVEGSATAALSAAVMVNNITVSMVCFAGGALLGITTIGNLFKNGLMLGTFAAMFHNAGMASVVWTSILPHGVCELTAICLAGTAGLRLAGGILFPGQLPRRRSVPKAARESLVLFGGSVFLLVIAGTIEGFLSFTAAPAMLKWAITLTTFVFCVFYLLVLPFRRGPLELD